MSASRADNSGKSMTTSSPTFAFRFRSGDEELEELQLFDPESSTKEGKVEPDSTDQSKDETQSEDKSESENGTSPVKEYWNRLGKRSTSVDSSTESSFSNSSETWRKLNELKGKITKTVEEKIYEMKTDRNKSGNMLGITTNRSRFINSKENSSISDSEDTSESSRLSEPWRDAEEVSGSPKKTVSGVKEALPDNAKPEIVETEAEVAEPELRNRKSGKLSDVVKLSDIKISTAKLEPQGVENQSGEVESGVEADETFTTETRYEEIPPLLTSGEGGSRGGLPPSDSEVRKRGVKEFFYMLLVKNHRIVLLLIGYLICVFLPMSQFFRGFCSAFFVTGVLFVIYDYINQRFLVVEPSIVTDSPFEVPDYKILPPLRVPPSPSSKGTWFNEYTKEYDPDLYSVTQTIPVFVELNDIYLKMSYTKAKINKRATFDEPEYKHNFTSSRMYDLRNCTVLLLPDGLARRRLFSKKYPITIVLRPNSIVNDKEKEKDKDSVAGIVDEDDTDLEGTETDDTISQSQESAYGKLYLNLFARCDREKEEWYRKLFVATKMQSASDTNKLDLKSSVRTLDDEEGAADDISMGGANEPTTPFENVFFDQEVALMEEYLRYMTKFVDINRVSPPVNDVEEQIEAELMDPMTQVQWFNAFVNRILFDVFRSPYWIEKIREKMQKKLTSIRLPYYVEDIEITELDLGKMGPRFHRVSQPVLDGRGLWFDMDVTFDGLVKVTIQTQLNLMKLQKGVEGQEDEEPLQPQEKPKKAEKKKIEKLDPTETLSRDPSYIEFLKAPEQRERKRVTIVLSRESVAMRQQPDTASVRTETVTLASNDVEDDMFHELDELFARQMYLKKNLDPASQSDEVGGNTPAGKQIELPPLKDEKKRSPMYDSELEDSAESSDEDDFDEESQITSMASSPDSQAEHVPHTPRRGLGRRSSKKIFRIVENVAQSKYFKSVAQSKYVQKAIAGVSGTKLELGVEVKSCVGTLTINIPPPPSDRIWYGFREMPKVWLSAHPKIGKKSVRFTHIKNFLEKKIMQEFKKVLVIPNMDEFILPTTPSLTVNPSQAAQPPPTPTPEVATPAAADTASQSSSQT